MELGDIIALRLYIAADRALWTRGDSEGSYRGADSQEQ